MASDALVLTGATATGKTALSLEVARRLDAEIISLDSRQVYAGMDVGTAKVGAAARAAVPHHGLDLVPPSERYSAGRFARDAHRWIREIRERNRIPLLVGGTGFFLRALTHPLFQEPDLPPERRRALAQWLAARPTPDLLRWLDALDPARAAALRAGGGRQRLLRALEVALLSGRPLSWWHAASSEEVAPLRPLVFVLALPREELDRRIDRRVDDMLATGLVEEVRGLLARGYDRSSPGMSATGYVELLPYLDGRISLDDAAEGIRRHTRQYARRQATWLRHQLPPGAITLDALRPPEELAAEVVRRWREVEAP
jgi:tRNA dimethylallyltransferase